MTGFPATGALLDWGERHRRDLPWRASRDPWLVLVSEVMLQQTQAARVVPVYEAFVARFASAQACAGAPLGDVLRLWQGLGYPRRARDLHAAAVEVVDRHRGRVPGSVDELLALPGVGPYTARAVLVFAFEQDHGVVDTNVGRLLARWGGRPIAPAEAQRRADELVPEGRAWEWNQALFDLGATVCRKRLPECAACPVSGACRWSLAGRPDPDPADGSAATSRRQAPFAGSDRQLRGSLLAAIAAGPVERDAVATVLGTSDRRAATVVAGLVADRLLVEHGDLLDLPC